MSKITLAALIIFAVTYILMMAFQKIRPYVTIASALISSVSASYPPLRRTHSARASSQWATQPTPTASLKRCAR